MIMASITMSLLQMNSDKSEMSRLLEDLEKVLESVTSFTWDEVTDGLFIIEIGWILVLDMHEWTDLVELWIIHRSMW